MDFSGAGDGSVVKRTGVRRTLGWSVVGAALAVVGCEVTPVGEGGVEEMSVVPVAAIAGPSVSVLSVMVSAADIEPALLFNIEMVDGTGSDTLRVPTGPARTFTVEGVSGEGIVTHRGSKTIDVREGLNATLTVALSAVAGDQPVVVTLGGTVVRVTPGLDTTVVGMGPQYTAEVVDEAGDVLPVGVRWATSNAGVAVVDETGVVTGVSEGTARIGATYEGVGGEAAVYVGGPELIPSLSGVVEAWGEGKSGVTVRVEGATGVVDVVTDGTGSYTVGGLLPGSYQVTVSGYTGVRFQSDVLSTGVNWGGNWAEFAGKPDPEPTWVDLSVSGIFEQACGVTGTGDAYCWGRNFTGQLGNGEIFGSYGDFEPFPHRVSGNHSWLSVSAGNHVTCGITSNRDAYCWGEGTLGDGIEPWTGVRPEPVLVAGGLEWAQLSAGSHHCGVTTSGEAYCWGNNEYGELGTGDTFNTLTPALVVGGHAWAQVVTNQFYSCGIVVSGDAYCWGLNSTGQLGNGTQSSDPSPTPTLVSGGLTFSTLDVGWDSNQEKLTTCAVTTTNEAYCWGHGARGERGDGTYVELQLEPVPVVGSLPFTQLSMGAAFNCGVTTGGDAYCWGQQGYPNSASPAALSESSMPGEDSSLTRIYVGSCALTSTGRAYCWGGPELRAAGFDSGYFDFPTVRVGGAW
jgi:alpha-tubulin suppressor-like RCC1 family protein